jgi:uncharacterized repeat protein (TIGR01451 family)
MRRTRHNGRYRSSRFEVIAITLGLALVVTQAIGVVTAAAVSALNVDLDQYANTDAAWQNGDLNGTNSAYNEGDVVPFRLAIEGLTAGSHAIHIDYDFTAGGVEAYDFLATWNVSEHPGLCDAGGGAISSLCGGGLGSPDTMAFPSDPFEPGTAAGSKTKSGPTVAGAESFSGVSRNLTMYGGTITGITGPTHAGAVGNNSTGDFIVTFDKVGTDGAVLFAWGGHLAESAYWKTKQDGNNGASQISGAPWHMRTQQLDGSGNKNQDRSIQPSAIVPLPGLEISKSASSSNVSPGDTFTYTIRVSNSGSATASPVVITDDLENSLTNVSATYDIDPGSGSDGSCTVGAGNTISCPAGDTISLAKSDGDTASPEPDVVEVTVSATAPSDSCPTLLNTASAQLGSDTPISSNQVTVTVSGCAPDIRITKKAVDANGDPVSAVAPGGSFTYVIDVTNPGNTDATGVIVTDDLDDTLTIDSASYRIDGGSATACDITVPRVTCPSSGSETLAPGSTLEVTIDVTTDAQTCKTLLNTGHVGFDGSRTGLDSNEVGVDVTRCSVDLTVTKSASSTNVSPGGAVTFTVVATNNGSVAANAVQITDTLANGLTINGATWSNGGSSGTCAVNGQAVACDVGSLTGGESATVTITVTATTIACPSVVNTAHVSGSNEDEGAKLNDDSEPVTVNVNCATSPPPAPPTGLGIQIVKGGPALAHIGDTIVYTLDASLTTSTPLTNITVTDPTCDAAPTLGSKTGGDQDAWLEPGETWHYRCTHVVTKADADPLPNTATVSGTDSQGRDTSDTDSHLVDLIHPAIEIVKRANPLSIGPGESVTYTYKVTNVGDVTLYNVSVDDDKLGHICDIARLDVGETQTCTKDFRAGESNLGPLKNIAVAEGEDETGFGVRDSAAAQVDVVLGTVVTPTSAPPGGTAFTGSSPLPTAAAAIAFLLIGTGLIYLGRRREDGSRA